MSLRCLIVEDQMMFLELLEGMLSKVVGVRVVATASSVGEAIAACERENPNLVILDLTLPDGSGVTVADHLAKTNPAARAIILSGEATSFVCPKHLRTTIHAMVDKTRAYDALISEIQQLLPQSLLHQTTAHPAHQALAELTPRESEILELIGQGASNKEVASTLFISVFTVQTHRKNIIKKLCTSGSELVSFASLNRQLQQS